MNQAVPLTRVMLWTSPRCVSTAFEQSVRSLPGVYSIHEPFTSAYYFGADRRSPRYLSEKPIPGTGYKDVVHRLQAGYPGSSAVFVKDMAYALDGDFDHVPDGYAHSFLIRDPRRALPSMYRIIQGGKVRHWRDFNAAEAGFREQAELCDYLTGRGLDCTIVDADDLLADPASTLQAYCKAVGLTFDPAMLSWGPDTAEDRFENWGIDWYETVSNSTGFIARPAAGPPDNANLPEDVRAAIHTAMPFYEKLREKRLRA